MEINRPNEFISHILKWENREIMIRKIYRKDLFPPPLKEHSVHVEPRSGEKYYTFSWKAGNPPANAEIAVSPDYYFPPESGFNARNDEEGALHNHDFFEILYVYSGKCMSLISGKEQILHAGDICLYNLQAIHRIEKFQYGDVIFNILIRKDLFQRSFLDMLAENDLITDFFIHSIYHINNKGGQIVLHPDAPYRCEDYLQQMIEVFYRDEPMSQSTLKAMLILLLGEMTRQYRNSFGPQRNNNQSDQRELELSDVIEYINNHYESITLEQLAANFGYTPRSMLRYFQKHTDTSFKEIVQHLRFHHACECLRESAKPINDIAVLVGYTERSSFDRAFKQRYRVSPVEYRKRYQNRITV